MLDNAIRRDNANPASWIGPAIADVVRAQNLRLVVYFNTKCLVWRDVRRRRAAAGIAAFDTPPPEAVV